METQRALLEVKSKDYLLGYLDCMISMKNQAGCERIEFRQGEIITTKSNSILGPVYLDLTCQCGNYIAFKNGDEIPDKSFKCTLCEEQYMIFYTDEEK